MLLNNRVNNIQLPTKISNKATNHTKDNKKGAFYKNSLFKHGFKKNNNFVFKERKIHNSFHRKKLQGNYSGLKLFTVNTCVVSSFRWKLHCLGLPKKTA